MPSTKERSFVKAFGWEVGMFLVQTAIFWAYLGNFKDSIFLNVVITFIKVILLFIYERVWKKIRWGKY